MGPVTGSMAGPVAGRVLVAVDGGNSKCDAAVVGFDGTVLATGRGPGFRPQSDGPDVAVGVLLALVARVLDRAGASAADVAHLTAYLANVDLPDQEARLEKTLLDRGVAAGVTVGNDTFALLRGGAAAGWGVAVVCGAGINCLGVAPDGRVARFPALGPFTGDWGGGAELGRAALWHAVRAEDGRGPRTALAAALAAHFGVERATDAGLGLYLGDIDPARLLEVAPLLLDAAETGDAVALGVVDRLAEEVCLLGTVALRRLDLLDGPAEVVLGGGILAARRPVLMTRVAERYRRAAPRARLVVPEAPPLLGAVLAALDQVSAPESAHAAARQGFGGPHRSIGT